MRCLISFIFVLAAVNFTKATLSPADRIDIQNSLSRFTKKLWAVLTEGHEDENLIFSPLFLQIYITMFAHGSTEQTRKQLMKTLDYRNSTFDKTLDFFKELFRELPQYLESNVDINNHANLMGQPIAKNLEPVVPNNFDTYFEQANYINVSKVNRMVNRLSNQEIRKLVKEGEIKKGTFAALVNTFKLIGNWKIPFNKKRTKDSEIFYEFGRRKQPMPMMHTRGEFMYAPLPKLNATAIVLPLQGGKIKMLIIKPNEPTGLRPVLNAIVSNSLNMDLTLTKIELALPDLSYYQVLKLNDIMKRLGLSDAFSDDAHFEQFFYEELTSKLCEIRQRISFKLTEKGLSVYSGTFINLLKRPWRNKRAAQRQEMRLDHPFLFMVLVDGMTLFAGYINEYPIF